MRLLFDMCTACARSQDCGGSPSRRDACTTAGVAALSTLVQGWAAAQPVRADDGAFDSRQQSDAAAADTTITDRVFLDIGMPLQLC